MQDPMLEKCFSNPILKYQTLEWLLMPLYETNIIQVNRDVALVTLFAPSLSAIQTLLEDFYGENTNGDKRTLKPHHKRSK